MATFRWIKMRPDYCLGPHLRQMLNYGCTCLEIGVQNTYEDVARDTNRGHTVAAVADCFSLAQDAGFKSVTKVKPYICTMPLKIDGGCGWNNIQLNLADLTKRAYGTTYVDTLRVQVHANCRLRRVYFSDRLHSEELLPEFKLYLPIQSREAAIAPLESFH